MNIETVIPVSRVLDMITADGSAQVWIGERYQRLTAQNLRRVPGVGDVPDTFVFSVDDVKPSEVPAGQYFRVMVAPGAVVERVVSRKYEVTVAVSSLRLTQHPHYRTVLAQTVRVEYHDDVPFRYDVSGSQVRKDGARSRLMGTVVFRGGDVETPEWVRELGERYSPARQA